MTINAHSSEPHMRTDVETDDASLAKAMAAALREGHTPRPR